jgi:hypothetical protein
MNKKFLHFSLVILIAISSHLLSQTSKLEGSILRVRFDQTVMDTTDTLGQWYYVETNDYYDSLRKYSGHTKIGGNDYFFINEASGSFGGLDWKLYIEDADNNKNRFPLYEPSFDGGIDFSIDGLQLLKTENGVWILIGKFASNFISNDGSFSNDHITTNTGKNLILMDIIGKIGDNYISAFQDAADSAKYYYFLVNLNNSPNIYVAQENMITFSDSIMPIKIALLKDDLFLVDTGWLGNLAIYKLTGLRFDFAKRTNYEYSDWTFRNNKHVEFHPGYFNVYDFRDSDTSFVLDTTINNSMAFDNSHKYGAELIKDTLYICDVDKGKYIHSIYTNDKGDFSDFFIDSPYVYMHYTYRPPSPIYIADDANLSTNLTYKLSAYPNPFNPQTTIAFTIPNAGKVELAVYDLLGRKVTELLNEYRDKGSYEIKFNGANLASGIYFYTIKTGNFVKTEKLMLLK